jgi:hypothetical protein
LVDATVAVATPLTVFEYDCPLTALAATQPVPVYNWMVSVPFRSGCPLVDLTVAESLGTQVWILEADEVSVAVTCSVPVSGQAVTAAPFVLGESPL